MKPEGGRPMPVRPWQPGTLRVSGFQRQNITEAGAFGGSSQSLSGSPFPFQESPTRSALALELTWCCGPQ